MARPKIVEALIWVAKWVCGLSGILTGLFAWAVGDPGLYVPAAATTFTGLVGFAQQRFSRPRPLVLLVLASTSLAVSVPLVDRGGHIVILPALVLLGSIGVLAMPRRAAIGFAIFCGLIEVGSLPWVVPDASTLELVLSATLLAGVQLAGWRFISLAGDLLVREEESHRLLLDGSPVAILEEDFSQVAVRLEELRQAGVTDIASYLTENPTHLRALISMIQVRRANEAAVQMIGADSVEDLVRNFSSIRREQHELGAYVEQFAAIWEGRSEVACNVSGVTLAGQSFDVVLHWSAPSVRGELDLGHVIVTLSDIAPRKVVEERLTDSLDFNRRLLEIEQAIASCSRALLLSDGEDALETALESLRRAIDTDRAYLAMNVEDREVGQAFHVVKSALRTIEDDPWFDQVFPWSRYSMMRDDLAAGRPFRTTSEDAPGRALRVSVLSVPVFLEGQWVATVGFVDMDKDKEWDDEAVRMLEVAAPMLGTFWERETTRQRLEDLVRSKDRFVASVSHELRTPLAAVLGFAEELKAQSGAFKADELTEMLELIADQSQEMADMVEDLLVSARADIGTVSIHPQDVYLRAQAETVLAGLAATVDKDIEVIGSRGKVWADPSRTRQIIRNLITNATRYGGDTVTIEAREGPDQTVLTVVDDGPGIERSMWETVFEPYQRAHEPTTQPASIGLGLTVSRQLARMMGGDVNYRHDERGSVFTLILPAQPPESPMRDGAEDELIASGASS